MKLFLQRKTSVFGHFTTTLMKFLGLIGQKIFQKVQITEGVLLKGNNKLEIEVTNLSANRIRYLDKKGIVWRKFYDINFVDITYNPFDAAKWLPVPSGLLSEVKLVTN